MIFFNSLRPQILLIPILFLLISLPSYAEKVSSNNYLPEGGVDGAALIGPPPAVGSQEFKTQMAIVMWLQLTRTPDQVEFVKKSLNLNRFAPILGDQLFDVDGVLLRQTLSEIIKEVRDDYDAIKAEYDLPRPFAVNENVKPPIKARPVGSYPSGHSIRGVVYASILGEIFPDKKQELLELGLQIGYGRAIAGVHYPMDIISGQVLGKLYSDVIIESPAFKEALLKIRAQK